MDDRIIEFGQQLSVQTSIDGIWTIVCKGLSEIGFAEVNWGHVDPATDPPSGTAIRSTLPAQMWRAYFDHGHYAVDPLVAYLVAHDEPLVDHHHWHNMAEMPELLRTHLAAMVVENALPARFAVAERALGRTKIGILALGADVHADRWRAHAERNMGTFTMMARLSAAYLAGAEPPALQQPLSPREAQCLELLAQGHRNDRIAERLGLHRATVDMHIVRARTKLGARTREQAIAKAVAAGAISP